MCLEVDIAFQEDDVGGTYAPISVPYFNEQTEGGGEEKVDKRPTLVTKTCTKRFRLRFVFSSICRDSLAQYS